MTRYLALLRGVNVGGKNKVSMPTLAAAFTAAGYAEVSTYINSGNVLFSAGDDLSPLDLGQGCEKVIFETFGLPIPVLVIPAGELTAALCSAPDWWGVAQDAKHNAIFVLPPYTAEDMIAQVGGVKPEYEKVATALGVIFWSAPLATFSRAAFVKLSGLPMYAYVTIRNANTTWKLAELIALPPSPASP